MKKICFITYHNWETKRHGGFHQFAQATAEKGIETVFFSFSRPYYIKFKHEERLNSNILEKLSKGVEYKVGKGILFNVTWPTLALPGGIRKFFPYKVNRWLMTHSLRSFKKFKNKWLQNVDCFVFESCDAVLLASKIKKEFPKAKIVYRPSDPLWEFSNDFFNEIGEQEMLKIADRVLTVNQESIEGYQFKYPEIFDESKYKCIPNGVYLNDYQKKYECPAELNHPKTACYIGSFLPDWNILSKAAEALPHLRFIIITPHKLDTKTQELVNSFDNLIYIDGIPPIDVPKWITNCDIVIQPFPSSYGRAKKYSMGLTAQNYKAMAANRPIVTCNLPLKLSQYGLITSNNTEDFIKGLELGLSMSNDSHLYSNFDINSRDWKVLCQQFIKECI